MFSSFKTILKYLFLRPLSTKNLKGPSDKNSQKCTSLLIEASARYKNVNKCKSAGIMGGSHAETHPLQDKQKAFLFPGYERQFYGGVSEHRHALTRLLLSEISEDGIN